jgi:hypothetical protein
LQALDQKAEAKGEFLLTLLTAHKVEIKLLKNFYEFLGKLKRRSFKRCLNQKMVSYHTKLWIKVILDEKWFKVTVILQEEKKIVAKIEDYKKSYEISFRK